MFNKENIKKIIIPGIILITLSVITYLIIDKIAYKYYNKTMNAKIAYIVDMAKEKYPNISEEEIIKSINSKSSGNKETKNILREYGYTSEENSYIKQISNNIWREKITVIIIISLQGIFIMFFALLNNRSKNKKIKNINNYLNGINNNNYSLKIEENEEDEISKLRNELYKTTIVLKEAAENSEKERERLGNSLADISHQLKTPLTSIRIMLDNIQDNPEMDEKTREEFLNDISKQIDWISSLIISLLKLARFDAGAIVMDNKEINVEKLIDDVIKNLSIMLDIKDINIDKKINENYTFVADYKWQLEAITNIVKNAIEHSKDNTTIHILAEQSSVYLKIMIKDEGEGISKEDKRHIFERFYKSKKCSENSIGIGLSLSKTIIEQANGYITVDSKEGEGTTFIIKYLK